MLAVGMLLVLPMAQGAPIKSVIQKKAATNAHPSSKASDNEQAANGDNPNTILSAVTKTEKEQTDANKSEASVKASDSDIQGKLAKYTLGLLVVGFLQALILAGTVWAIIQQTRASRASQRPWVLIERIGNPSENWRYAKDSAYIPGIVFEFKVYGATPIKIIEGAFDLTSVPNKKGVIPPSPDLPEFPDYSRALPLPHVPRGGIPWAPSGTYQIRRIHAFEKSQMEALNNYEIILCGYGYLKYVDVFKTIRETRVCYIYFLQRGGAIKTPDGMVLNPEGFYMGGPPEYNRAT